MGTKPDQQGPVAGVLDRVRANRTGRLVLRIGIAVLGAVVVVLGVALIPLPGPGWALVILGLAILALEFVWAKSLLDFTRRHVRRWTDWVVRRPLPVRLLIGAAGLVLVSIVVWTSVRLTVGVDLIEAVRRHLTRW